LLSDNDDAADTFCSHHIESLLAGVPPVVSGEDGLRALETAYEITRQFGKS